MLCPSTRLRRLAPPYSGQRHPSGPVGALQAFLDCFTKDRASQPLDLWLMPGKCCSVLARWIPPSKLGSVPFQITLSSSTRLPLTDPLASILLLLRLEDTSQMASAGGQDLTMWLISVPHTLTGLLTPQTYPITPCPVSD